VESLTEADASTGRAALVGGRMGAKRGLEPPGKNVAEDGRYGELDGVDPELGNELAEVDDAVSAGEVGGDVDVAVGVARAVEGAEVGVGCVELPVDPLHLDVVGRVGKDKQDGLVGVGDEVGAASVRDRGEGEDAAGHAEELELRDRVPA